MTYIQEPLVLFEDHPGTRVLQSLLFGVPADGLVHGDEEDVVVAFEDLLRTVAVVDIPV